MFAQLGIEVTPVLVISERIMPTDGSLERIPPNKNGAQVLVSVEAQQKTRKFDDLPPRFEPNDNIAAIGGIALGKRNWLFAGNHSGSERAAPIYSIPQTAKSNAQEG